MPRYKRSAAEAQLDIPAEPQVSPEHAQLLSELRNMWEFASLMQYIFLFGHVVKIDEDFDVEVCRRSLYLQGCREWEIDSRYVCGRVLMNGS